MSKDWSFEGLIARLSENPEFAEGWAEDQPRIHLGVNVYRLRTAPYSFRSSARSR